MKHVFRFVLPLVAFISTSASASSNYTLAVTADRPEASYKQGETVYFLGMFLRLVRALDFLTAQPEWDGRTVIVHGSSQGGYQSLVTTGETPPPNVVEAVRYYGTVNFVRRSKADGIVTVGFN